MLTCHLLVVGPGHRRPGVEGGGAFSSGDGVPVPVSLPAGAPAPLLTPTDEPQHYALENPPPQHLHPGSSSWVHNVSPGPGLQTQETCRPGCKDASPGNLSACLSP